MSNGQKEEYGLQSESFILTNSASEENRDGFGMPIEEIAATQIQKAYRAYTVCKIYALFVASIPLQFC